MKIKKKIVILILILSIFSAALNPPKKVEATSAIIAYAVFKAGVSFTAFAGFAQLMYVNGYHMQISDLAVSFANQFYDYANGVYIEKGSKINAIEKLALYTSSFLSGNDILSTQELNNLKESILESYPSKINIDDIVIDSEINTAETKLYSSTFYESVGGMFVPKEEYKDKIIKLYTTQVYPKHYVYLRVSPIGYSGNDPIVQLISPQGQVYNIPFSHHFIMSNYLSKGLTYIFSRQSNNTSIAEILDIKKEGYVGDVTSTYKSTVNSFSDGSRDFVKAYPNYYSALSGKASTVDELENLMNTDEYLQREVAKLLENQKVNEENVLLQPEIAGDGSIYYPGTQDLPDVPSIPYDPGAAWYNDLIGWVSSIPDVINTGLDNFWQNNLNPALDNIGQWVTSIPTAISEIPAKIAEITDITQDITTEQIDFSKLRLDGVTTKFPFSIPFDYVKLLKNFKRDPIEPDLRIKLNTHYFTIDQEISTTNVNKYIVFFRWFALTVFVYALMMITRKVIKW